jgi:HlyD family secretion protein
MVRESQALVRLPDLSKMRVKVTIHESRVDQIRPGMPARVAIQDQEYDGRVLSIANQPQAGSWYSAKVKEYATAVSVEGGGNSLRPGMTAKVTILIDNLSDALSVPVSAVVEQRGQFFCWVKTAEGPQRRPLKLGRTNDKLIEVVDGVKEGEDVLRNPRAMVGEAREELPFEKQSNDAKFIAGSDPGAAPAPAADEAQPSRKKGASPPAGEASTAVPTAFTTPPPASGPGSGPGAESRGKGAPGDSQKRSGRGDLMQFDKDGDKKLAREELPERMQSMFERLDQNHDGFIDSAEIAEMRRMRKSAEGASGGPSAEAPGGGREGPGGPDRAEGGRPAAEPGRPPG